MLETSAGGPKGEIYELNGGQASRCSSRSITALSNGRPPVMPRTSLINHSSCVRDVSTLESPNGRSEQGRRRGLREGSSSLTRNAALICPVKAPRRAKDDVLITLRAKRSDTGPRRLHRQTRRPATSAVPFPVQPTPAPPQPDRTSVPPTPPAVRSPATPRAASRARRTLSGPTAERARPNGG